MRENHGATMRRSPSRQTRERLNNSLPKCECGPKDYQLSYQKCRFCDRGWPDLRHLFKYAVRHYVCRDCLDFLLQLPPHSYRSRPR